MYLRRTEAGGKKVTYFLVLLHHYLCLFSHLRSRASSKCAGTGNSSVEYSSSGNSGIKGSTPEPVQ